VIEEEGDELEDDGIVYGLMYYVNHHCKLSLGFAYPRPKSDKPFKKHKRLALPLTVMDWWEGDILFQKGEEVFVSYSDEDELDQMRM